MDDYTQDPEFAKFLNDYYSNRMPSKELKPLSRDSISTMPRQGFLSKAGRMISKGLQKESIMEPKTLARRTLSNYANTGKQILDFTVNQFGPDVANELMANAGGNVEFLGRLLSSKPIQNAGQTSEDYWRARQSKTWNNMSGGQKAIAGVVIDPFNALVGGLTSLTKPVRGLVKAGTKQLGRNAIIGTKTLEKVADTEDALSDLTSRTPNILMK